MKISLLAVTAVLAIAPLRASAADICAPHAALLKIAWRVTYERPDGPSRMAALDKSECSPVITDSGVRDFDNGDAPGVPSAPEPRLRFWSESSPYELSVELDGGWARVVLMKRDGRYRRVMARIDQIDENELAKTTLDYTGNVADGEYPEIRAGRGVRKIVRSARVLLTPVIR